jgi:hypothetical protein
MDPLGPILQRFPLVARPRPPCTPLTARISALAALADTATLHDDLTAASRVLNQAALIASDCGQPELARAWCHRHARAHLLTRPRNAGAARQALEPLVNLARLHIRAGDGDAAIAILDDLCRAVDTRVDTVIDGVAVPTGNLTATSDGHADLRQWLWTVQLADGTRALTAAGRWHDAEVRLRRHNGIGRRMLDGRQVAVIARIVHSEHDDAFRVLAETEPGEPWEAAVVSCLTAIARTSMKSLNALHVQAMVDLYESLPSDATLAVFRTRLALSIADVTGAAGREMPLSHVQAIARDVLQFQDGYAARELLTHPLTLSAITGSEAQKLTAVLHDSGLGRPLPAPMVSQLEDSLARAEALIRQRSSDCRSALPRQLPPLARSARE